MPTKKPRGTKEENKAARNKAKTKPSCKCMFLMGYILFQCNG